MKIHGGCHCSEVRYEAEIDPDRVTVCHCTDCQTLSGTAFRTSVQTLPGSFRLLSGTPRVYVKVAESGNRRDQAFCPTCGTPLYSAASGARPTIVTLRVGTIAQRDRLVPRSQVWCRSAQAWTEDLSRIPRVDTEPAARPDTGAR